MKNAKTKKTRIIAIAAVTFFSLCANVLATVAWFTSNRSAQNENDYFAVKENDNACIESVYLYKFNYHETTYGSGNDAFTVIDYLTPETGEVKKYAFDEDEQEFGEIIDGIFNPVTVMNIYDPIEKVIKQNSFNLLDLNCNAVYEINFSSSSLSSTYVDIFANWLSSKTKNSDEIFLTDCVDFDSYLVSELADSNPNFSTIDPETSETINKMYYPSYIGKNETLTDEEDVYYKISYLSSLNNTHLHFYGNVSKPERISLVNNNPRAVTFDNNGKLKLFVNVNYAPSELEKYQKDIYESNIKAVYDYSLTFNFVTGGNS